MMGRSDMADKLFFIGGYGVEASDLIASVALVASGLSAWYASRQAASARKQAASVSGDLEPAFTLRPAGGADWLLERGDLEGAILTIDNRNRRPIKIRTLQLVNPLGFGFFAYRLGQTQTDSSPLGVVNRPVDVISADLMIEGSGSSRDGNNTVEIRLFFKRRSGIAPARGQKIPVKIKVAYDVYDVKPKSKWIALSTYCSWTKNI